MHKKEEIVKIHMRNWKREKRRDDCVTEYSFIYEVYESYIYVYIYNVMCTQLLYLVNVRVYPIIYIYNIYDMSKRTFYILRTYKRLSIEHIT